jgi:vacuolar-type H+-ATPase subunit I/STV1
MSLGRRFSGLVLIGLGAIGMAVALAGIAGVWVAAAQLRGINSRVFHQVDKVITRVDRRATQARDAVGGTRDLLDTMKQSLQASAAELLAGRLASLPEIENLEQRLASAMERADELLEVSASTAELIEALLATLGADAPDRSADRPSAADLVASVQAARESLADATQRLADVQRRLAEIRQNKGVDVNLAEMTKLSLGIVAKLDVVQSQIAAFRSRLDETRSRSTQLEDKVGRWILAGECLSLFLVAWIGAGQFCLLLQGRRVLRKTGHDRGPAISSANSPAS